MKRCILIALVLNLTPQPPSLRGKGEEETPLPLSLRGKEEGAGGQGPFPTKPATTAPAKPNRPRPPEPLYETRKFHDFDGIGKFYMGREIAHVMGYQGAAWLDRPEREKEEEPAKMVDALKLKPGDVVADVGAGTGTITFRLADKVGPKGKVYAVDVQKEMIALLRKGVANRKAANVEPVQCTITDPKLPPNSVDLIIMVDVYHEFSHPYEMTLAMLKALKVGGRLVFVEYRLEDPKVPIKLVHKMSERQVLREMAPHPLEHVETIGILPRQHIIVFKKLAE
jgi:precorrin-6B methylase 2